MMQKSCNIRPMVRQTRNNTKVRVVSAKHSNTFLCEAYGGKEVMNVLDPKSEME